MRKLSKPWSCRVGLATSFQRYHPGMSSPRKSGHKEFCIFYNNNNNMCVTRLNPPPLPPSQHPRTYGSHAVVEKCTRATENSYMMSNRVFNVLPFFSDMWLKKIKIKRSNHYATARRTRE